MSIDEAYLEELQTVLRSLKPGEAQALHVVVKRVLETRRGQTWAQILNDARWSAAASGRNADFHGG